VEPHIVLKSSWEEASYSTKYRYKNILLSDIKSLLQQYVPGNEEAVWEDLRKCNLDGKTHNSENHSKSDNAIEKQLIEAYNAAETSTVQKQILSIFPADKYTKHELTELIPGVTISMIDQARKRAIDVGAGASFLPTQLTRQKMDMTKAEHFVEFMLSPAFTQDVAFGTKNLKFDSGDKMAIPNVIRTVIITRIISLYQVYCAEHEYEALSRSSLYKIGHVCLASQRKALQGLDNISAVGLDGFDKLIECIEKIGEYRAEDMTQVRKQLLEGKNYMKTKF
jgi:hypothetical protein